MTTAYLARFGIVTSPLIPQLWGTVMGKFDASKWAPTAVSAVFIVGAYLFGAGGWISGQAKDVQSLQSQVSVLQTQQTNTSLQVSALRDQMAPLLQIPALLVRLNDRLDATPRADQMVDIQKHLSALDGRADADETRARADADRTIQELARDGARLDFIEKGSDAKLGNRR